MKFEPCPVCGRKGWYVQGSPWNLEHYRLHYCRYCASYETIRLNERNQIERLIVNGPEAIAATKAKLETRADA